jgi:hypothetical protein
MVVGRGLRDSAYPGGSEGIVWHHHFTERELKSLIPAELEVEYVRHGGLFIFPLTDFLRWPFYRAQRHEHPVARALASLAEWDYGMDYGAWSYGILMVAHKTKTRINGVANMEPGQGFSHPR